MSKNGEFERVNLSYIGFLVSLIGVFAPVLYFLGRAQLIGWYKAAGVSQLAFSWSTQDLIIMGLAAFWVGAKIIAAAVIILVASVLVIVFVLNPSVQILERRLQHRLRDGSRENFEKRNCIAQLARESRLSKNVNAIAATQIWKNLGKRGRKKRSRKNWNENLFGDIKYLLFGILLSYVCAVVWAVCYVAYGYFIEEGKNKFYLDYLGATGRYYLSQKNAPEDVFLKAREAVKNAYPFVKLTGGGELVCGWLVNYQNGTILLMSESGLILKTYTGQGFSISNLRGEICE